ncbi:MAG: hypothetical protein SAK29_06965 [Scytonema sp. PMC 1069.18]|nr:hypothetical protein [Scytonema sp. PMC 1069.18]MEC4880711.1 hypothetical protein [Scytonema sp. PMC 1070.18]
MSSSTLNFKDFEQHYSGMLSDYVTAIAWSPDSTNLVATSAEGEVALWQNEELATLQVGQGKSVDCVAFSYDGQFLAVGGQDGKVRVWQNSVLITTLENSPAWVDRLSWSPTNHLLAFSLGRYVQVWDADSSEVVVTLNFENSSVLDLDWRCDGQYLAICGHRGIKVWNCQNWDDEPYIFDIPSACLTMAWSPDGKFLASGNMDKTIAVVESHLLLSDNETQPWIMRGFPGKIRQLAWSERTTQLGQIPLVACCSVDGIVVWEKQADDSGGWEARILTNHVGIIQAIAFAPNSFLLASAATDGWLCLWEQAQQTAQILTGVSSGFSCLAWHPQGNLLAAGGDNGELLIWSSDTSKK